MKPFVITKLTPADRKLPHREHEPERKRRPKPPRVKAIRNPICTVDGCGKEHHAHGYCWMHVQRLKRRGTLNPAPLGHTKGATTWCSVCGKRAVARKLCGNHYKQRWYWRRKLGLDRR